MQVNALPYISSRRLLRVLYYYNVNVLEWKSLKKFQRSTVEKEGNMLYCAIIKRVRTSKYPFSKTALEHNYSYDNFKFNIIILNTNAWHHNNLNRDTKCFKYHSFWM